MNIIKKLNLKRDLRSGLILFAAGFAALFFFRLAAGLVTPGSDLSEQRLRSPMQMNTPASGEDSFIPKNYATSKMDIAGRQPLRRSAGYDQKYERIADIAARSHDFDGDDKKLRGDIGRFKAVIQVERRTGLPGERSLFMTIGVAPESFDELTAAVGTIGTLLSKQVTKTDKTNEYQKLTAQKLSLQKTLDSLKALKGHGGKIEEFVNLENRILEIEEKIQALGVSLGQFDAEHEFCTVKFTLTEGRLRQGISFLHRLRVALEWTIKYYCLLALMMLCGAGATYFALRIVERSLAMKHSLKTSVKQQRSKR